MGIRIRANGVVVCAATTVAEQGDVYVDDTLLHVLHQRVGALEPCGTDENGADLWAFATHAEIDRLRTFVGRLETACGDAADMSEEALREWVDAIRTLSNATLD